MSLKLTYVIIQMFKSRANQILIIIPSTALAAFSLISVLIFIDPFKASLFIFVIFYLSLFLVCLGLFTILGLILRKLFSKKIYIIQLSQSFRQAVLISLLITFSAFLQANNLLFWWVEISLVLFLIFFEIFANIKN